MKLTSLTLVATLSLGTAAWAQSPPPSGDADKGKKIFAAVGCYQCHGYVGQGSSTAGGVRIAPTPIAYAAFTKYLREPTGEMPPYGPKILPDQQIADIYAYLQSVPRPPARNTITLLND
jgi:ubiquinol-cytochrome c reductase cytochrome c subunit